MSTFSYHADFQPALLKGDANRYLKKWFATAQKSFCFHHDQGSL
jgi:hypothetical protein